MNQQESLSYLSFNDKFEIGTVLGRIIGSDFDGEVVYAIDKDVELEAMNNEQKEENKLNFKREERVKEFKKKLDESDLDIIEENFPEQYNKISELMNEMLTFSNTLIKESKPIIKFNKKKDRSNTYKNKKSGRMVDLKLDDDSYFQPLPDPDKRFVYYICGMSGSGKSTFASQLVAEYHTLFPNNMIYIFSRVPRDKAFDSLNEKGMYGDKFIRVNLELIEKDGMPDRSYFSNMLLIFDDIDTIPNKMVYAQVMALCNDMLETGRHTNTNIIRISHLISDYSKTRTILNECTHFVCFPRVSSQQPIKYALETYFGVDKNGIDKMMSLPSRYVQINKNFPRAVCYNKGCYVI